jgi:Type VI secretion system/phage-baseplate injector OB domain
MSDLFDLMGGKEHTGGLRSAWVSGLEAIVAVNEDPEHQHRIKVVIPEIDEHVIYDKWVRRIALFVGAQGYGDFHVPEIGSEVILFGRFAEKHNLFYAPVYNEDFIVPPDFASSAVRGFRTDGDYKQIVELDHDLRAGRMNVEVDSTIRLTAPGGIFINGRRY